MRRAREKEARKERRELAQAKRAGKLEGLMVALQTCAHSPSAPSQCRLCETGKEREQRLEVLFGDEAQVEEQALEALATLLLEAFHLTQILGADPPLLQ